MPLERFLARYSNREDPFKYEWNQGHVEKYPRTMNRDQTIILQRLMRLFTTTKAWTLFGELISEVDMYMKTHDRTRRADIAYLTPEQVRESRNGQPTVCPFVIEVISKNDQINPVQEKLLEYFQNGIEVVWVIYPRLKKVEVHRSIRDVKMCFEEDICSAAPVLPDFQISVNALFAEPVSGN